MQGPLDNPIILKRINYHTRLQRLVSHMREHMDEDIGLHQASRIACMERTAFSKFFSRTVGITFHSFVQQWRVAVAIDYMLKSDSSLSEVAFAAGFQNVNSFTRTFKKVTAQTPSDYRRQLLISQDIVRQEGSNRRQESGKTDHQVKRVPSLPRAADA